MILRALETEGGGGAAIVTSKTPNQPKIVTIKQPTAPTAEVLARDFNVEQLPTSGDELPELPKEEGGQVKKEEPKEEEPKKEEPKKEEIKKEEKKGVEEKKEEPDITRFLRAPDGKKEVKKVEAEGQFDYNGYSESEVTVLKNMSRQSRDFVAPLMSKVKDLEKEKGGTIFQHPEAYTLDPNYQAEVNVINLGMHESQILSEQLRQVKLGKPIKVLKNFDAKGNPVYGAELAASDDLEEQLRMAVQQVNGVVESKRQNVVNWTKQWKQTVSKDLEGIASYRASKFPWIGKQELQDHLVPCSDGTEKPIKTIRNDVISLFPPYLRNSPGVDVCADLVVSLILAQAEIAELKKNGSSSVIKKEEKGKVEPSSDVRPRKQGDKPIGGVSSFSTNDAGVEL